MTAWTGDDLPDRSSHELREAFKIRFEGYTGEDAMERAFIRGAAYAERQFLNHLNTHYPKPSGSFAVMLEDTHRAQRERDAAVERAEIAEDQWQKWEHKAERVERERDAAVARAEASVGIRTAPAVTREDVKGVIDRWIEQGGNHEALLDDLWRWVSGSDPAVHVVRESDIAAVEVTRGSHGEWFADGAHVYVDDARQADHLANGYMTKAVRRFAVARAIEAKQAVDPVEDAAVAAFKAAWHRADEEGDEGNRVRRGIRAARHVLGQEASSDE